MNSVISVCGSIVLSVLVVNASHDDGKYDCVAPCTIEVDLTNEFRDIRQGAVLSPPFTFSYDYWTGLILNVEVKLKNLSPDVEYTIYKAWFYETDINQQFIQVEGSKGMLQTGLKKGIEQLKNFTKEKYTKTIHYKIKIPENSKHINMTTIYLTLQTKTHWCKNITILEAKALSEVQSWRNERLYDCLKSSSCTIEVDLSNECIGFPNTERHESSTEYRISTNTIVVPDLNYFNRTVITSADVTETDSIETNTGRIIDHYEKVTDKQPQLSQNLLKYVIPSVIGMCVIYILVLYMTVKKYRHRNSNQVNEIELNTYATASDFVYADLSLAKGDSQPPRREEESPYAQIIGVMRP